MKRFPLLVLLVAVALTSTAGLPMQIARHGASPQDPVNVMSENPMRWDLSLAEPFSLTLVSTTSHPKYGKNAPAWSLGLIAADGDTIRLKFKNITTDIGFDTNVKAVEIVVTSSSAADPLATDCFPVPDDKALMQWAIVASEGEMAIAPSWKNTRPLAVEIGGNVEYTGVEIMADPGAEISVEGLAAMTLPRAEVSENQWTDNDTLTRRLAMHRYPLDGIWHIRDREMDETLLRMGGDYRLALVGDDEGYDIIYLDGAVLNAGIWQKGMPKGRLDGAPGTTLFNALWRDADRLPLNKEIKAIYDPALGTLSIIFPFQNSVLRLVRAPGAP